MYRDKTVLDMADDINSIKNYEEIAAYYVDTAGRYRENTCHLTVLLLGMCINRELTIRLRKVREAAAETAPEYLAQEYHTVLDTYRQCNRSVIENTDQTDEDLFFLRYLNSMAERLLSGIRYEERKPDEPWSGADEYNERNTQYRREERIRDQMKELITGYGGQDEFYHFTVKHRIQLPYMYVLAWDLPNLLDRYEDRNIGQGIRSGSYFACLPENVRTCLSFLDDDMLEILLYGFQMDEDKEEDPDSCIGVCKRISYLDLLPAFIEVEEKSGSPVDDLAEKNGRAKARAAQVPPCIRREILAKKPLVPMELDRRRCNIRLLRMMVDVLKEENKTRQLNGQLEKKNAALEKLNAEKVDMMDYYAHSWKHISYPKIVKDVAEALLGRDDDAFVTMANKLLRAYNSEQTLKHGIQLLQYSISEDREKVKKEFKKGFFVIDVPKEDGIAGIDDILYESLDMVILKLMMDDIDTSRRMKKCRSRIENISMLREEYTEMFLKSTGRRDELLKWVNERLLALRVEISEEWRAVRLDKESFAAAQMTEIFVELFTNIFQHGEKSAKLALKSGDVSMDILEHNDCAAAGGRKDGKGIRTLENVIDKINFESRVGKGLVYRKTDTEFSIQIRMDKKTVYRG